MTKTLISLTLLANCHNNRQTINKLSFHTGLNNLINFFPKKVKYYQTNIRCSYFCDGKLFCKASWHCDFWEFFSSFFMMEWKHLLSITINKILSWVMQKWQKKVQWCTIYSVILSWTIISPTLDYRFDLKQFLKSHFHYFSGNYNDNYFFGRV